MTLKPNTVYYKDQDPDEWEYVQKNDVGKLAVFSEIDGKEYLSQVETPIDLLSVSYAFNLYPKPPEK